MWSVQTEPKSFSAVPYNGTIDRTKLHFKVTTRYDDLIASFDFKLCSFTYILLRLTDRMMLIQRENTRL